MTHDIELVRGKGNVSRDFGYADADAEHLKAVLAAQIIKVLDKQKLSVRTAGELTGIAAADFSRVRRAKLDRFTIDRLMTILGRLDRKVDVAVNVRPKTAQRGPHCDPSPLSPDSRARP
ncbi:MAG TPA: helix-turn-helix transcriptional regulator [Hyphomicrobiaceae bacterium]|jgi:predicted XRE-type DNA-binding protein